MRHEGTQVKLQRERLELTKTALAQKMGVSTQAVFDYERRRTLTENVIKKLQTVFGDDWSPDKDVFVFPQGIEKVAALLKERGVKVRIEGNLIYFS